MKKYILLILSIFLLTGCGLNIGKKESNNKETENSTSKDNVEIKEEIKEESYQLTAEENGIVNYILHAITYDNNSFKFDDLDNEKKLEILMFLASMIHSDQTHDYGADIGDYYNKDNLNMIMDKYFGPYATVKYTNKPCSCGTDLYIYDSSTGKYHYNDEHGGHGGYGNTNYFDYRDITIKGNVVTVKAYVMFSNYIDIGYPETFYKTDDDAYHEKNVVVSDASKYCHETEMSFTCDERKMAEENKFNLFNFEFIKDENGFYFNGYTME